MDFIRAETAIGAMLLEEIGIYQSKEVDHFGEKINPIDSINAAKNDLEETEKKVKKEIEMEANKILETLRRAIRT